MAKPPCVKNINGRKYYCKNNSNKYELQCRKTCEEYLEYERMKAIEDERKNKKKHLDHECSAISITAKAKVGKSKIKAL